MKHFEVNFTDQTVETVGAEELPSSMIHPLYRVTLTKDNHSVLEPIPASSWWSVTLLHLDAETSTKLVTHGKVHINLNNVTFIKEC